MWTEAGGRTIAIPVTRGVCEKLRGDRRSSSATEVRIVVVRTDTSNGHPCTMQAVLDTVRVPLQHQLGDRTLMLDHREQR